MASPFCNVADMQKEIIRLTQAVETLKKDAPGSTRCHESSPNSQPDRGSFGWVHNPPPTLQPYDTLHEQPAPRPTKRKEIEARRYSGKESIIDYLKQFELTAKRNQWGDSDKASALLCALDGTARSILSEIDDDDQSNYLKIKHLLLNRFGPVLHTEVHEQALRDLKLARGQPIRELSTEVTRLAKLAYPDFEQSARCRLATNALINAICDKDVMFYIKDKNPSSVDEVCTLYERYRVLTGSSSQRKPAIVNGVKPEDDVQTVSSSGSNDVLIASLVKQGEAQQQQVQKLTDAVALLLQTQAASAQATAGPSRHSAPNESSMTQKAPAAQPRQYAPPQSGINRLPPGPCPRCKEPGHWRRDCPRQQSGNAAGPSPAPGLRSHFPPANQ